MRLFDQHLHSRFSFDCKSEPRANVEAAIARGLSGLIFTEHFDTHPRDWAGCIYDDEAYSAAIAEQRAAFGNAIFVGKGIEVCYQPDRMDFILDFLSRHRFDMVMLSVHYFGGVPVHRHEHWSDISVGDGTRSYLENVREAMRFCARLHRRQGRVFDVLGHLDVVKRYSFRYRGAIQTSGMEDLIDQILQAALEADVIPEINTSSLRQNVGETMPNQQVLRRYAELGGQAVSLGSDSHRSDDIGAGFDHAVSMLRTAGPRNAVLFRGRDRHFECVQ